LLICALIIQAIGFIFPIHWSEHFALQNVACQQAIGFIFPIHWSELSTSLKATLRVSDLSFGSLSEHFTLQNVAC